MERIIIVSNRLPITIQKRKGNLTFIPSVGGLATGLSTSYKSLICKWIGWPGLSSSTQEEKAKIEEHLLLNNMLPVFLTKTDIKNYYEGFSNETIWPLFHYFTEYAVYDSKFWETYKKVNNTFCKKVLEIAKSDDLIWVHDYHLMLLPELLRKKLPEASIGFFLHIPFPSFELFRTLPWRQEILRGILGADLIGFHTYDYARHFLSAVSRLLGIEHIFSHLNVDDRIIKVDSFPMGIDYEKYSSASNNSTVKRKIKRYREKIGDRKIILSVDRLDYSKGILQRLEAFKIFIEENPQFREKVTLVLAVVPSRSKVEYYRRLKESIDKYVGQINGKYGTVDWIPILYFYYFLPFHELTAFYYLADVALITPFRDGMNLIAKEYVATKKDKKGVIILSEMAGAATELSDAIIINPNNTGEIADAIRIALKMPEEEQVSRISAMQRKLKRYDVKKWTEDFIDTLLQIKKKQHEQHTKKINTTTKKMLLESYKSSTNRLILLDYDGTLVPFTKIPSRAGPNKNILELIEKISSLPSTEVVLISGRDKDTLQNWFGKINIGMVAEHGALFRDKSGKWELIEPLTQDWKSEILPILEFYTDKTPGSFIEEKEFSLVWHYRSTDPTLGEIRVREIVDTVSYFTANMDLQLLEGNKVVEIKNSGINKGRAALRWVNNEKIDFILAIGDDWTDEDIFRILPEWAYSIKVGYGGSVAKYRIESPNEVIQLLTSLLEEAK